MLNIFIYIMSEKEGYDLDKKFKKYSEKVKRLNNISNDDKLYLYAHYKQALFGNNMNDKPSIFNRVEMEKWKSWTLINGMNNKDAMKSYIKKVKQLYKE